MAGDWIKLEHATLDKPEVARLADLLNISTDASVGLLVRFWVWLDRNSCNGCVTHMYARPMESIMHCPGFVAAMTDIGWLSIDETTGVLTIPNASRHSFEAAKSRALTRDRVKRLRNDSVTLIPLPEKRREEITPNTNTGSQPAVALPFVDKSETKPSPKVKSATKGTALPADFAITDSLREWAQEKGYGALEAYLELFIGRNRASGKRYVDWPQAFQNAVREDWYGVRSVGHKGNGEWWASEAATLEMAGKVGVKASPRDSWPELRAKIREKLG